jgi:hypothetical protein
MDRPDEFGGAIAKPEWLNEGLLSAEQTFRLVREGRIPSNITGWMLQTACLRVLRAIHGSDLDTVAAIRDAVMDKELRMQEIERLNPKEIRELLGTAEGGQ